MESPIFSPDEYVDVAALQNATNLLAANSTRAIVSTFSNGLLTPENITLVPTGLTLNVIMLFPAGIVLNGVVAFMHGTTAGTDSSSQVVNFAPFVPGSGSITAYLYATTGTVQESQITIPGPPPGHPSWDPNFVATQPYSAQYDTIVLGIGIAVPSGAIEIARTTLTAGQTTLGSFDETHQVFAGAQLALPVGTTSVGAITVDGNGRPTITAAPTAVLVGSSPTGLSATVIGSGLVSAVGPNTISLNQAFGKRTMIFSASGTLTIPAGVTYILIEAWGGGGGGGGSSATGSAAGGGGGGSYFRIVLAVTAGATIALTIGLGGAAGTGSANGGAGTATSFVIGGTTYTASFGTGGTGVSTGLGTGGAGGAAGTGDEAEGGGNGTAGQNSGSVYQGGIGGPSPYGGASTPGSLALGAAGFGPGAGGAGGANGANGGNGATGRIRVSY